MNLESEEKEVGTLVLGFVTSYAPRCIESLEETLYEFIRPPAQETWIRDLRQSPLYAAAREEKIAELKLRLPLEVVQALETRLLDYDKAASHQLRTQVEPLPEKTRADYAALVTLLGASTPSCIPASLQRTLYRAAWEESGLERNPLHLKTPCPNCTHNDADLYLVENRFDWEIACKDCGYEDRAAKDMPSVSFNTEPKLTDQTWSSWACSTSALFGEWPASVSRRNRFMATMRDFVSTLETQLPIELASTAHALQHTPSWRETTSFSPDATAVILARVENLQGEAESIRIHDPDANQLARAYRTRASFSLMQGLEVCPHWKGRFDARITDLRASTDTGDTLPACIAAGQLLLESRWYGFLLPVQMTVELPKPESLVLAQLATHPQHLAAFLRERMHTDLGQAPSVIQLERWLREYLRNNPGDHEA